MKRARPVLLVFAALALCVSVATAETLKIATFNIENYTSADRMTEAGYRKGYPKPEAEKSALRQVIRGLNADILVLQEVGPRAYFDELRRDLKAEGLDYTQAFLLEGPDVDRHIALLSKIVPVEMIPHVEMPFKYLGTDEKVKRGVLETHYHIGGVDFTLWALHLKSRFTERNDDLESAQRRAGEATAIRELILKQTPDPATAAFMILGDFNDVKASKPVRFLSQKGKMEFASLLPVADSHGEAWTYFYRKEDRYERVDHLLVSVAMKTMIRGGAGQIYDEPEVRKASDHRPVSVVIEVPEK